jgi:hypothetical protein
LKKIRIGLVLGSVLLLTFAWPVHAANSTTTKNNPHKSSSSKAPISSTKSGNATPRSTTSSKTLNNSATKKVTGSKIVTKKNATTSKASTTHKYYAPAKKVYHYYIPPKPKPAPAPWPPFGEKSNSTGVYGKMATFGDLLDEASNSKGINDKLNNYCTQYVCGGVYLASLTSCESWEIDADVVGTSFTDSSTSTTYGHLVTYAGPTNAKQVTFYLLQSSERYYTTGFNIANVVGKCQSTQLDPSQYGNIYTPDPSVPRLAPGTQS